MKVSAVCLRNIKRRRLRILLCICGIALSIAFFVGVSAAILRITVIIREMNFFFKDEIVVTARDAFIIQGFPIGGTIPERIEEELMKITGVRDVIPMLFILESKIGEISRVFPMNITIGLPLTKLSSVFPPVFLRIEGNLPSDPYRDILVGKSIADQYGLSVGSTIHFKGKNLTITGIIRGPSILLSRSIIASLRLIQETERYDGQISMAVVRLDLGVNVEKVADEIEEKVNYVVALTESERNELTYPILEELSFWNYGTKIFMLIISGILIAIVEIMNISESRRDFATLIAIGASETSILKMILAETSLIGILGGLLGLLFGSIAAVFLASFYMSIPVIFFIQDLFNMVPPNLIVEVLALVIFICVLGSIFSTIFALKINVSENLRSEY